MASTIKIFIASSSELVADRKEFREYLSVENDRLHKNGVYLELIQWEYFLDVVSETRLQDEYNEAIKTAHIVICLFYTKAGKYTQEEFDTALSHFKETGSPLIYTYFKSGAPQPDPSDQLAKDLVSFKDRLSKLGHFYTSYSNIDNLKLQFRQQLDRLEDKGHLEFQNEIKVRTQEAVTNYFNVKNAVIDSNITAGGDVHVGDNITQNTTVKGSNNIIIQGVSESSITVNVDGQLHEVERKLDALQALMEQQATKSVQTADKVYNIGSITNANFGYLMGQAGRDQSLPTSLSQNLVGSGDEWIKSLGKDLLKEGIPVGDDPIEIFHNYDWLIQVFLQKMCTPSGREKTIYAFSFMVEAYEASLRYLCYIQMAQLLELEEPPKLGIISSFLQLGDEEYLDFDYTSLLLTTSDFIGENSFVPEIYTFVEKLRETDSDLFGTAFFLESERRNLLSGTTQKNEAFHLLMEEYLTALIYWLKNLSFLANYRLVSINDINLNYRIGSDETYLHRYAELHSVYNKSSVTDKTKTIQVKGSFTYSKSILLFRGNVLAACLRNIVDKDSYISLSPFLIDKSVYDDVNIKQTPEIFHYTGYQKEGRQYTYSPYNKELPMGSKEDDHGKYPTLYVKSTNTDLSGLDDLFEQLEETFNPFKIKTS
ncbi:hypothetical protein [Arenibacter certesii]|uniref:DUF4062 domain-containing protein n=1 Tax=Arenibacter certesii TaxID=228955 RepID=A0A918MMN5_9FLAO|nr:hypothetical protein [Arenibacter certesii]GGW36990.1 hypothetical protein GCM10007383_22300 [Arenibacter certesii]